VRIMLTGVVVLLSVATCRANTLVYVSEAKVVGDGQGLARARVHRGQASPVAPVFCRVRMNKLTGHEATREAGGGDWFCRGAETGTAAQGVVASVRAQVVARRFGPLSRALRP
jgi:hypothetical protein